jgi:hypothetical protein
VAAALPAVTAAILLVGLKEAAGPPTQMRKGSNSSSPAINTPRLHTSRSSADAFATMAASCASPQKRPSVAAVCLGLLDQVYVIRFT